MCSQNRVNGRKVRLREESNQKIDTLFKNIYVNLGPPPPSSHRPPHVRDWTSNIRPYSRDGLFLLTANDWSDKRFAWPPKGARTAESPGNKYPAKDTNVQIVYHWYTRQGSLKTIPYQAACPHIGIGCRGINDYTCLRVGPQEPWSSPSSSRFEFQGSKTKTPGWYVIPRPLSQFPDTNPVLANFLNPFSGPLIYHLNLSEHRGKTFVQI